MNSVSERVLVGAQFDPEILKEMDGRDTLIVCDAEGAEAELIDPVACPFIRSVSALIVECHEKKRPGVTERLTRAFAPTHQVHCVEHAFNAQVMPEFLRQHSHLDQLLTLWEWRPGPTPWLVLTSKQARVESKPPLNTQMQTIDTTNANGLTFLYPVHDIGVGRLLRDYGEFAPPEIDLICDLLKTFGTDCTFIDAGANLGAICLPVAKRIGCRVMAFEANRLIYNLLAANALGNALYNVETFHAAVGDQETIVQFPTPDFGSPMNFALPSVLSRDRIRREPVRMCRLDGAVPDDTRVVKIDVEGFEPNVLRGARSLVQSCSAYWILEAKPNTYRSIVATMRAAGYDLFWFVSPFRTRRPPRLPANPANSRDTAIVAVPRDRRLPPNWDLAAVEENSDAWTRTGIPATYLTRYGWSPATRFAIMGYKKELR
jgi:FkbM family methyltransferase